MTDLGPAEYGKLALFWAGWFYFPAAALLLWLVAKRRGAARVLAALVLLPLTVLAYARFVEPRILVAREHEVTLTRCMATSGAARVAVFSDTHIGLFANAMPVSRIARRVNALNPDLVMIAGDFTYWLAPERFAESFQTLGDIKAPVYAVMGNHDVGLPGPDVSSPLTEALTGAGVITLNDAVAPAQGGMLEIAGLSDLWAEKQDYTLLEKRGGVPRLVLTHNPRTIQRLLPRQSVDLLIAGHTHGGQINLPVITCALMQFSCSPSRYGFAETERGLLFVTSGTGMVGLPMRFNVPPVIDVLTVRWNACAPAA